MLVSPTNAGKYKSLSLITGTATEYPAGINAGLSNVKLSISNTADTQYWTGSTWEAGTENASYLTATGTGVWSYGAATWSTGNIYRIKTKATDLANNRKHLVQV